MGIHSFLNDCRPVYGWDPGLGLNVERTSDYISLENYRGVAFFMMAEVGAANADTTVRLLQAKTAAGGDAKALLPRDWYRAQAADITTADGSAVTRVAPVAAGCPIEGSNENLVYCEVDAAELDLENGFKFVALVVDDDADAAAKLSACLAIAYGARHKMDPTQLQSAIA